MNTPMQFSESEDQLKKDIESLIKKDYITDLDKIKSLLRFPNFRKLWEGFLRDGGNPHLFGVITGYSFKDCMDAYILAPLEDVIYWAEVDSKKRRELTQQQQMKQWSWDSGGKAVDTNKSPDFGGLSLTDDPNIKLSGEYHIKLKKP